METVKGPNELLVRWDAEGRCIVGAHVRWSYTVRDGDQVIARTLGDPVPAGAGNAEGFPLADAIGEALARGLEAVAPVLDEYPRFLDAHNQLIELARAQETEINRLRELAHRQSAEIDRLRAALCDATAAPPCPADNPEPTAADLSTAAPRRPPLP